MAETALHKELVRKLADYLRGQGVNVTNAAGGLALPDPIAHGRHEPDVTGTRSGVIWIGEAKTGEGDIDTQHAREQYRDFSHRVMKPSQQGCPFVLCVPRQHEAAAFAALSRAGADMTKTKVVVA